MALEDYSFTNGEVVVLLKSQSLLSDLFEDFLKHIDHMDLILECMKGHAEALLEAQRKLPETLPANKQLKLP